MNRRAGAFLPLVPGALAACLKYRLRLWLRRVETLNLEAPPVRAGVAKGASTHDISRAVYFAARLIPGTHCLPQSLAVRELMARAGRKGEMRIGVSKTAGFRAHAWVVEDGETVHGRLDEEFVALTNE